MAFYQLIKKQKLPATINEVWDFISSPTNLKEITPEHMGFIVTSTINLEKMYPGMIIAYKVSPLFGIKINWMTEITHVKDHEYFVDEQSEVVGIKLPALTNNGILSKGALTEAVELAEYISFVQ